MADKKAKQNKNNNSQIKAKQSQQQTKIEEESSQNQIKKEEDNSENSDNQIKQEEDQEIQSKTIQQQNKKRKNDVQVEEFGQQAGLNANPTKQVKREDNQANINNSEEIALVNKWWESEDLNEESLIKWKYLENHGVVFPDFWERHNVKPHYDGKPLELNIKQEEMATYWAQTLDTQWEENPVYLSNFKSIFMPTFSQNHPEVKDFAKFNFRTIRVYLDKIREEKKNRPPEDKKKEKLQKSQKDSYYGGVIIDNVREKVGSYIIEPPTLFKGRGKHPKAGLLKARIMPEKVVINISKDAPVPKCPMPGHNWKEIVFNNEVTWFASYKDNTIKKIHKYFFLSANSKFKGLNDKKKYEKARKLKSFIQTVRSDYEKMLISRDLKDRQIGTATYLIDFLALRVGNEKDEDEAETYGCCSLQFQHIKCEDDGKSVSFDFLGKDSMRYQNTVQVKEVVWKNIKNFLQGKKEGDSLFERIDAQDLNDYLKSLMPELTAKVFRTYNASITLQKVLDESKNHNLLEKSVENRIDFYDEANKQVAILCNHQKTVSKKFDEQMEFKKGDIEVYKTYLLELRDHLRDFKKGKSQPEYEETVDLERKGEGKEKKFTKKFPATKEKTEEFIKKWEKKILDEEKSFEKRIQNKDIALNTSKTNYNDPRISVAWCKTWEVPIEKIFPTTLRSKFLWAMYTEPEWKF